MTDRSTQFGQSFELVFLRIAGELHFHVMYKNAQFGTITGLLFFGPVTRLVRGPRTMTAIAQTAYRVRVLMGLSMN